MKIEEKFEKAMGLLEQIEDHGRPNPAWFRDYYLLTGNHMILTEVGWESGDNKEDYIGADGELEGILDEVNATGPEI